MSSHTNLTGNILMLTLIQASITCTNGMKKNPETIKNYQENMNGTEKTLRDPKVCTEDT